MFSFRIGPFPVTVLPWFFISAFLLSGSGLSLSWSVLIWVGVVFVSVLIHELGHAVVGKLFGGRPEIRLEAFGGVTFPQFRQRPSAARQFMLSFAGPVAGMLLGVAAWGLEQAIPPEAGSPSSLAIYYIEYTSFVWAAFNLLPILPLDGGQMMMAVIEGVRRKPSIAIASWLSAIFAVIIGIVVFLRSGTRQPFLLLYVAFFAWQNVMRARAASERKADPAEPQQQPIDGLEQLEIGKAADAARAAVTRGDFEGAIAEALKLEHAGGPFRQASGMRLRAAIELARRDNAASALLAGQSFSIFPTSEAAVVAARANLRSGEQERARNWLRRAAEAGAHPEAIRADPELGALT